MSRKAGLLWTASILWAPALLRQTATPRPKIPLLWPAELHSLAGTMLQVSFSLEYGKIGSECHTAVRMANPSMLARTPPGAVAQARMQMYPVVNDFEAIEDRRLCLGAGAVSDEVDVLDLERAEEALHGHVIHAVPLPPHGPNNAVPLERRPAGS